MSKFVIREVKSGVKFDLLAGNGEIVATSESYTSQALCRRGIESVRKIAPIAQVETQTEESFPALAHPKFQMYQDRSGHFRFRLRARNGKIIAVSEAYATKSGCLNGIECVKKSAPEAQTD